LSILKRFKLSPERRARVLRTAFQTSLPGLILLTNSWIDAVKQLNNPTATAVAGVLGTILVGWLQNRRNQKKETP